MLKVGLYGFGGIAQTHKKAYEMNRAAGLPVELVAACDIRPEVFKENTEINISFESDARRAQIRTYAGIDEMLANERLDVVDICLPTYLHADAAVAMLERGYHVLCEKPMARTYAECLRMVEAARQSKGQLMIAQCMRFRPEYEYIKELIESEKYGKVVSAYFNRLSAPPVWAWENWYMSFDKSGGCIQDMHIHDVDMIRYWFGDPDQVGCTSRDVQSKNDSNCSRFIYGDRKIVVAVGDWSLADGFGFEQSYRVAFERATVIYENDTVVQCVGNGKPEPAPVQPAGGYAEEIAFFINMIVNGTENNKNRPVDSAGTVALIEKLRDSAAQGGRFV